ncbi:MAG: glutathione S-transferase N-terminal domain-containing protein [Candidatus Aenigmarchaeota archaeon]|nr:glutathione S-transferase N-terminal domain-containing protein [Candidatus Aenigmarchaeota archaeon]
MPKVIIYSTPTCTYCKMAKEFFRQNSVQYTEIDVAGNEKAQQEMISKSGQYGVPVIDIDGKIIVGFDKGAIKKALNLH